MKFKHLLILGLAGGLGMTAAYGRDRTFGDGLPEYLKQFDVNEDGVLDEEERQAARAAREERHASWVAKWDTDGSGDLSAAEIAAAREAIRAEIQAKRAERFAAIAGEDGCLSLEEFAAIPVFADADPARVAALYDRLDSNDDRKVSLEEFNARLRRHRSPGDFRPPEEPRTRG